MDVLKDEQDFYWHKKKMNLKGRYDYEHNGIPEKYPCMITSEFWDNPNGPYTYYHNFYYKQTEKTKCDKCGHTVSKTFWPKID